MVAVRDGGGGLLGLFFMSPGYKFSENEHSLAIIVLSSNSGKLTRTEIKS